MPKSISKSPKVEKFENEKKCPEFALWLLTASKAIDGKSETHLGFKSLGNNREALRELIPFAQFK